MAPETRTIVVQVRMSPTEHQRLIDIAGLEGLTASEHIRALVRKDHETRFGVVRPKPKKKGARSRAPKGTE